MTAPAWLEEARALRDDGTTLQAVADRLGQSKGRVAYWLDPERGRYLSLDYKRRYGLVATPRLPCLTSGGQTPSAGRRTVSDMAPVDEATKTVSVRMPVALANALEAVAEHGHRTVSDELRALARQRVTEAFTTTAQETA